MDKQIGVVFIHGAGLGGWIWESVAKLLDHPALITDFPNRESKPGANSRLSLCDYCDELRREIDGWQPKRFVIVAHSIGGIPALKLAAEMKSRVAGFAGVSAIIPAKGGDFISTLPFPRSLMMRAALRFAGTKPPDGAIKSSLCNGISPMHTWRVVRRFTPESRKLYTDKCDVPAPAVRSLYIKLSDDHSMPPEQQEEMASHLLAPQVVTIGGGHLAMLSHPEEFAKAIDQFVRACA